MAFVTSHVEIAEKDRTINGVSYGRGQAIIVSDIEFTGASASISLDLCKIASFNLNEQFRVYKIANDSASVQGTDLVTAEESNIITSASTDFIAAGITTQMDIAIISGDDIGSYAIVEIAPGGDASALRIDAQMTATDTNLSWEIIPGQIWTIDYSIAITANIAPGSNILRYLPFIGPGDHKGTNAQVQTAQPTLIQVVDGNLTDVNNPVLVGEYIELKGGPDAGFYKITSVQATQLVVNNASWSADQTNLAWHIGKVSPHASVCRLHQVDGVNVVIPEENSVEVKIAQPIRDLADAQAFDIVREEVGGGFSAEQLFDTYGNFLACYRLQTTASHGQGVPLDDRVIIAAQPWRGHEVGGVLFFDDADPPQPKYFLSDANEPVWPIRWLRDNWRLEIAIARDTRQEPEAIEVCD